MIRFLFDVKFWQMGLVFAKFTSAIFCLICYCACAEPATVVLLALTLYKLQFSMPDFVPGFEPFWPLLVRMRRNGHKTTSGVKFDLKFDFPVPDFLHGKKFRNWNTISCIFSQFSAAQAQKRPEFYFRSNFYPQIWNPHGLFPIRIRNLVGLPPKFIRVLSEKRLL